MNALGTPDVSSFATYAYVAGVHLDDDDSFSVGWVARRSSKASAITRAHKALPVSLAVQVPPDESNFVLAAYKTIIELAADTHWGWDASETWHASTANRLCARVPASYKTHAKRHPDDGQWTRVVVLTKRLAHAARNEIVGM